MKKVTNYFIELTIQSWELDVRQGQNVRVVFLYQLFEQIRDVLSLLGHNESIEPVVQFDRGAIISDRIL